MKNGYLQNTERLNFHDSATGTVPVVGMIVFLFTQRIHKLKQYLPLLLLFCFCSLNVHAQDNQAPQEPVEQTKPVAENKTPPTEASPAPKKKKQKANQVKSSAIKEEIQRYMGYEILPARYLSLPYDTTMNTNVSGSYVDIGFLLFLLIPIIFLLGFWDKPLKGSIFMIACLFVLSTSIKHSTLKKANGESISSTQVDEYLQNTKFADHPSGVSAAYCYKLLSPFSLPDSVLKNISGNKDHITYPLLIGLFLLGFWLLQGRIQDKNLILKVSLNFIFGFCFLWLILAAGITWYGYLMIALGSILLGTAFHQYNQSTNPYKRYANYGFIGLASFWIFISLINRTVNYRYDYKTEQAAQQIFDMAVLKYQLGIFDKDETINAFFPNVVEALDKINAEDKSLVYRVGTIFNYYIDKNDRRVLHDSQLDNFNRLANHYKNKNKLSEALMASGYKYILVDLNTHVIDKTPEQSLRNKFNLFLNFLYENPRVELIVTNRLLRPTGNDTKPTQGVFGDVQYPGSFAIYEFK